MKPVSLRRLMAFALVLDCVAVVAALFWLVWMMAS